MSGKHTWLALVALAEARLPSFEGVAEILSQREPDVAPPELASVTDGMVTFGWGEATAAYTLVPRPIAWSQLEGPCATAWHWPQATEVLRNHAAHLLVTLVDERRDAVAKGMRLTRVTAAVAERAHALGIVWTTSGMVHEPKAFAELAGGMSRDCLPLHLWIDFRVCRNDDDTLQLFTTGLEAVDRKEIEVARYRGEPQPLVDQVYNVAHYQIDHRAVIKDGDTMGLPGDVQVTVTHAKSLLGDDRDVLLLEFDG